MKILHATETKQSSFKVNKFIKQPRKEKKVIKQPRIETNKYFRNHRSKIKNNSNKNNNNNKVYLLH